MKKIISLLILCFCLGLPVYAEKEPLEQTPGISPSLFKQLTKVEDLIASTAYPQARQMLLKILANLKENSYEQAICLRSLASVYALENNYTQATGTIEKCLATKKLPKSQQQKALLNLGQLYMATENYQKATTTLEHCLHHVSHAEETNVHVLLANAYAQLEQYHQALKHIQMAVKQKGKAKESWLQLNLALLYELKHYQAAANLLQKLTSRYPDNKKYRHQLAMVYQQLKQYAKALSVQHLAYKKGYLKGETSILQLFNLFLHQKQPYQAAELLTNALAQKIVTHNGENLELLANAWRDAREYEQAIQVLEQASNLKQNGQLYLQLGRIYIEQEAWAKAVEALNKAIKKGKLISTGEAYILLGMSLYETEDFSAAKTTFNKAQQFRNSKKSAQQWLNYIAQS